MSATTILVDADKDRLADLYSRPLPEGARIMEFDAGAQKLPELPVSGIFLLRDFDPASLRVQNLPRKVPVFVSALNFSLADLPEGYSWVRINGWPGFLRQPVLEISFNDADQELVEKMLSDLDWSFKRISDQPGMAVPRVIAMLINEACYAVHEKVSSKEEIDTAMKLGTNYPFGPFEWSRIIGPERVISLLEILSIQDKRYLPAPGIRETLAV